MNKLNKQELLMIVGGVSISASLINSLARGASTIFDLGKSLGSAIRRIGQKTICSLN